MAVAEFLFLVIAVYVAYRFIFNFVLPIMRATHQVRQQFRDMRGSGANDFRGTNDFGAAGHGGARSAQAGAGTAQGAGARQGSGARQGTGGGKGSYKPPADEYIDFEEVK